MRNYPLMLSKAVIACKQLSFFVLLFFFSTTIYAQQIATASGNIIWSEATQVQTRIYPVPAQDYLFVTLEHMPVKKSNLSVYSIDGIKQQEQAFIADQGHAKLSVAINDLPKGIYFLVIQLNNEQLVKRFIKK